MKNIRGKRTMKHRRAKRPALLIPGPKYSSRSSEVLSAAERVRALAGPNRATFKKRLKALGW